MVRCFTKLFRLDHAAKVFCVQFSEPSNDRLMIPCVVQVGLDNLGGQVTLYGEQVSTKTATYCSELMAIVVRVVGLQGTNSSYWLPKNT